MRIHLAWASSDPIGYEPLEVTRAQDIRSLPDGGVPTRAFDPVIDGTEKKWLVGVNVQGVDIVGADHIGPSIDGGRLLVHAWYDDPQDWPSPWGYVWSFGVPRISPNTLHFRSGSCGRCGHDIKDHLGAMPGGPCLRTPADGCTGWGKLDADQLLTVYGDDTYLAGEYTPGGPTGRTLVDHRPWAEFPTPHHTLTRHGIWIRDSVLWELHLARMVQTRPSGWREG